MSDSGHLILSNLEFYRVAKTTYEIWKKKSYKNDISKRENMAYDGEKDEYTCHNGKLLRPTTISHRTSATGYRSEITVNECEDCSGCVNKLDFRLGLSYILSLKK